MLFMCGYVLCTCVDNIITQELDKRKNNKKKYYLGAEFQVLTPPQVIHYTFIHALLYMELSYIIIIIHRYYIAPSNNVAIGHRYKMFNDMKYTVTNCRFSFSTSLSSEENAHTIRLLYSSSVLRRCVSHYTSTKVSSSFIW